MDSAAGVYERDGTWHVVGPAPVEQALAAPGLTVVPPGPMPPLQAAMARFSDGAPHLARRALVERLLASADELTGPAARLAGEWFQDAPGPVDVVPLARAVPVLVLAAALGVRDVQRVADAVAVLDPPAGGTVVEQLLPGRDDREVAVAVVSILFQARDATAALIGGALLQGGRVEAALRQDAPVVSTRRRATSEVVLCGVEVPAGAQLQIALRTAECGGPVPATFGSGPHACPGVAQARALAEGVLDGLASAGWQVVAGQPVTYDPRPNLRLPARLLLERT